MKNCPNCRRENPSPSKFCFSCGFKFTGTAVVRGQTNICGSCGTDNSPVFKFCRMCGKELLTKSQDSLVELWYCKNDSAIMMEIDPKYQIKLSKQIDESLSELLNAEKIKNEEVELIKEIANQVFKKNENINFAILTRIRCPICLNDAIASVHSQANIERRF